MTVIKIGDLVKVSIKPNKLSATSIYVRYNETIGVVTMISGFEFGKYTYFVRFDSGDELGFYEEEVASVMPENR